MVKCARTGTFLLLTHPGLWRLQRDKGDRDAQYGFMPGRGMADAMFAVRQRMEKHGETGLYINGVYRSRKGLR